MRAHCDVLVTETLTRPALLELLTQTGRAGVVVGMN
jgi:hypothetical protein